MIPQLPSKYPPTKLPEYFNKMFYYNRGIDDCLPRIKYLEGLVEELGEALDNMDISLFCNRHWRYRIEALDKYTTYKQAREVNND